MPDLDLVIKYWLAFYFVRSLVSCLVLSYFVRWFVRSFVCLVARFLGSLYSSLPGSLVIRLIGPLFCNKRHTGKYRRFLKSF